MANNVCPDCGRPLDTLSQNGVTLKTCGCGYQFNTNTGEEMRFATNDPSFVVLCPECSGMNRIYYKKNQVQGLQAPCAFCGTTLRVPEKPDPSIRDWAVCPHCSGKNRVPVNKGTLQVKCSHCSGQFRFDSGKWPETARQTAQPKAQAQPKAAPKAKPKAEAPKAAPKTQPEPEAATQGGFFSGVKSFFQERKENAEEECAMITDSPLTYYIGETIFNTLNDMRSELVGCGPHDHFCLQVNRRDCVLYFYDYDSENRLHQHHIIRCTYKQINDLFGWKSYEEIQSREARKWFVDVIYHEHIVRTGFLLRPRNESKRFGILRSQL